MSRSDLQVPQSTILVAMCPNCSAQHMRFTLRGYYFRADDNFPGWWSLWSCEACRRPIISFLEHREGNVKKVPSDVKGNIMDEFFVGDVLPEQGRPTELPDHVPENILEVYREALANFSDSRWTSSGMMFRKTLEMTTLGLKPNDAKFRKAGLARRIDILVSEGHMPDSMQGLAHEIRLSGNIAAHEETYSETEANQLRDFSQLFLVYMFTLPADIQAARAHRQTRQ